MTLAEAENNFWMAWESLKAHRLRSCLSLLAVSVGMFTIIVVMTIVSSMQQEAESNLLQLGVNTFKVERTPQIQVERTLQSRSKYAQRKNLTYQQGLELRTKGSTEFLTGFETRFTTAAAGSRFAKTDPNISLLGQDTASFLINGWQLRQGRRFTEADVDGYREVCLLGRVLAEKLFPMGWKAGDWIKFDGGRYEVVGVVDIERETGQATQSQLNVVIIPVTTGLKRYGFRRSLSYLVQAPSQAAYNETMDKVRGILRTLRRVPIAEDDDFEIVSNEMLIRQFRQRTESMRGAVSLISSFALLVAGTGIMNIMLVSVVERTREIGILRAVGAKRTNVVAQFLMEAFVISQIGGLSGIVLGLLTANLFAMVAGLKMAAPLEWILFGISASMIVGILSGIYPAIKASRLHPVTALQREG